MMAKLEAALSEKEKQYFEKADKKSRGRCFWPSDKEYRNFYLKLK